MSMDKTESVAFSLDTSQLHGVCSGFLANDDSEGTFSDTVDSTHEGSPSDSSDIADNSGTFSDAVDSMHEGSPSHFSDIADNSVSSDGPLLDRSTLGWETVDGELAIAFFPDIIVHRNVSWSCTDLKVIFFGNFVRACGSTAHGEGGFCINLAIEDIIDIRSQRCGRHEMVEVKINVISRDSQQVEKLNGTSCVDELSFCVVDSLWNDKIEEIISLNVKYKALWNSMLDTDVEMDMEALLRQKEVPVPKRFFPKFVKSFEEFIYPEGDPDAVSISMRDLDMLKPDTFINDTIIDFYIMYLKNTMILPAERPRFHFFNCFFFRKLADMDKDPSSAFDGRAAFLRVRKWTKKVDLFSKDFIFIPVNYSYHWSLIVICHPGEIVKSTDEDAENSAKVPCILHMDSYIGSHANLKDLIQSYLWEEWKERQRDTDEAIASKFLNLRFVPLEELPQQPNLFDCGLFLLHYLESFLEARLENFSPFMMKKSGIPHFLTRKWFLPYEPYTKRSAIIRLIHGLVNKHHFSGSNEQHCLSDNPKSNNDKGNDLEVIGAGLSPSKDGSNEQIPIPDGGLRIEMDLLQASSFQNQQGVTSGSGLVLREFFNPTSSEAVLLDVKHQALGRTSSFSGCLNGLPSIEEEVEADLQFVQTSTEPGSQHIVANDQEASALQYHSENYSNQRFSHEEHENTCTFPANPVCNSGGPILAEKCPIRWNGLDDHMESHLNHESAGNTESESASLDDHMDHPNHESAGDTKSFRKREFASDVTKDTSGSLYPHMIDHHDSAGHPISFLDNLPELSLQNNEACFQSGGGIIDDQMVADELEPQHQPAAKKMRLRFSLEMNNSAASLSEDLHL